MLLVPKTCCYVLLQVDPKELLQDGMRKELVRQLTDALQASCYMLLHAVTGCYIRQLNDALQASTSRKCK